MSAGPILVIAAAGIGRFVAGLGVLGALRAHHADARIVLLTAPATAGFASTAPYVDEVWTDATIDSWDLANILNLRHKLRLAGFARVYDLDHSGHSRFLFRLMQGWLNVAARRAILWSG